MSSMAPPSGLEPLPKTSEDFVLPLHYSGIQFYGFEFLAVEPRVSTALAPEERVDRSPSGSKPDVQAARLLGHFLIICESKFLNTLKSYFLKTKSITQIKIIFL